MTYKPETDETFTDPEDFERLRRQYLFFREDARRWRAFAAAAVQTTLNQPCPLFDYLEKTEKEPTTVEEVNAAIDEAIAFVTDPSNANPYA